MPRRSTHQGRIENRLDEIMAERHMKVSQVAAVCGVSRLTVYEWRNHRVTAFKSRTLARFCAGLGVDVGTLLYFVNHKTDRAKRR